MQKTFTVANRTKQVDEVVLVERGAGGGLAGRPQDFISLDKLRMKK
jgi:hypothetical protein